MNKNFSTSKTKILGAIVMPKEQEEIIYTNFGIGIS